MRTLLPVLAALCLVGFSAAGDLPVQAPEPFPAEKAAATMRVPEGFEVTLFAAEPDVRQPVSLCIDDRGRLWVAEAYSYPDHTADAKKDRILIFEDTDGDGRFDRRKVFFDRLNYVSGIEVGFGGVWVMSPPFFFFIPDRDGDDVPDAEPRVVLDGFGNHANSHNIANGFAWGPDGWLYGTHGRTNWSMIGKPGTPEEERVRFDGGVWRYHPVRDEWESFADGCTNPWGIDWDDYGQAFIPNTVDPHLFHAIQGAHYEPWRNRESSRFAYRRIETIADHLHYLGHRDVRRGIGSDAEMALGGGHSHCGILVYLGDSWPDRYRNTVFLHNTHGRRVNHDILARKGSGYTASHAPDLVVVEDPWFMGVNFRTGPGGSVFFTDWSDTGECHSTRNTRRHTGRIYRLSYGNPERREVDIAEMSDAALVDLQLHRNDWFVRHARRVLQERAAGGNDMGEVHGRLLAMFDSHPEVTRRLRALWALRVTGGTDDAFLVRLLDHESEYVRAWAIQFLCEDRDPPEIALEKFAGMAARGDSALVRLYLASALQRLEPALRWDIAGGLLSRTEDAGDQNLPLMTWYGIEPLVHEDLERFAGWIGETGIGLLQRHIARRIASLPEPEAGLGAVFAVLAEQPFPEAFEGVVRGLEGRTGLKSPPRWREAATALSGVPGLGARVWGLGVSFGDPESLVRLRALADDESASPAERIRALEQRLRAGHEGLEEWLFDLVRNSPVLRRPALRGLARLDDPGIAARILERYPEFEDLETRRDALQTLASRRAWAAALIEAAESGGVKKSDLTSYTVRQIRNLGDPALAEKTESLWGTVNPTPGEKRKRIDRLVRDLSGEIDEADPAAGRLVFQTACAACHKLFGEGGTLGPELTGAQRSSIEYLVENIVAPSSSVAREYQMRIIQLKDGRTLTGFFSAETETTLTIRTVNEEWVTPKEEIAKQIVSPVSMMPEGLIDQLDETRLRDLIGYLMSPRQVPLPGER